MQSSIVAAYWRGTCREGALPLSACSHVVRSGFLQRQNAAGPNTLQLHGWGKVTTLDISLSFLPIAGQLKMRRQMDFIEAREGGCTASIVLHLRMLHAT